MPLLRYDFAVIGLDKVSRALSTLERRFSQHNRTVSQNLGIASGSAGTRGRTANPATAATRELAKQKRLQDYAMGVRLRQFQQEGKNRARIEKKYNKEASQDRMKAERVKMQAMSETERQAARIERQQQARSKSAARQVRREVAVNRRVGASRRRARQIEERASLQAISREDRIASKAAQAHRERAGRTRQRVIGSRARGAANVISNSVTGVGGYIGRYAALGVGLAGTAFVGAAVRDTANTQRESRILANIGSGNSKDPRTRDAVSSSVFKQVQSLSGETGASKEDVLSGLRAVVGRSGRLDIGQAILPSIVDTSQAYGANIGDVGEAAAQVLLALEAFHPDLPDVEKIQKINDAISAMAGQANVGAIEFADFAKEMPKIVSSTSGFKGELVDLIRSMGAIGQASVLGGADGGPEAATALVRFRDDLVKLSAKTGGGKTGKGLFSKASLKEYPELANIDLINEQGTLLEAPEIAITRLLKATRGELKPLIQAFGTRGRKAFEVFQQVYAKAGGGDAGIEAFNTLLNRFKQANVSQAQIRQDARAVRSTDAGQFDIALQNFKGQVGENLLPALARLIPKFTELIPVLAKATDILGIFIQKLSDDPWGTIFKVIKAKLLADLAVAAIGFGVKKALVASLTAAFGGFGGGGAASAAGTAGGLAGAARGGKGFLGALSMAGGIATVIAGTALVASTANDYFTTQSDIKYQGKLKDTLDGFDTLDPEQQAFHIKESNDEFHKQKFFGIGDPAGTPNYKNRKSNIVTRFIENAFNSLGGDAANADYFNALKNEHILRQYRDGIDPDTGKKTGLSQEEKIREATAAQLSADRSNRLGINYSSIVQKVREDVNNRANISSDFIDMGIGELPAVRASDYDKYLTFSDGGEKKKNPAEKAMEDFRLSVHTTDQAVQILGASMNKFSKKIDTFPLGRSEKPTGWGSPSSD